MRIVINGFGRIGRTILRQILTTPAKNDIDIALINDIASLETCAYLFKYDSTFGPLPYEVVIEGSALRINGRLIPFSQHASPQGSDFPAADVVMECTGKLKSREMAARGLASGARAVLISGPSDYAETTAVLGANEQEVGTARIISNSSCTTNAIAPLMREIDKAWGWQLPILRPFIAIPAASRWWMRRVVISHAAVPARNLWCRQPQVPPKS